jgi:glycosyltransferase involved in cell wall biosynthesis
MLATAWPRESDRQQDSAVVSVIIPAYRAARYIAQALDSVVAQTYGPVEIIVVNDASPDSDELEHVLSRFGERVRYLRRETNGGPGAARNTGIMAASGEYLAFLDADDYWDHTFLAQQLAYVERHPDVALVYCNASWFLEGSGQVVGTLMSSMASHGEATFESLIRQDCTIGTSAVLVRRQAVLDAGLFDSAIGNYSEDFDLYLRLTKSGARVGYHRALLVHHRLHAESLTAEPARLLQGVLRVLDKTARRQDLSDPQREALATTRTRIAAELAHLQARLALSRGDFALALQNASAAHAYYRTWKLKAIVLALRLFPAQLRHIHRLLGAITARRAPTTP